MEMLDKYLSELIELVEQVAPEIWAIYLKQMYSAGITWLILSLASCVLSILCYKGFRRYLKTDNEDAQVILAVCLAVCTVVTLATFLIGFRLLFNPEYYAIQQLLGR